MVRKLAPLLLFATVMLGGCDDTPPASMAQIEAAIAENRFMDARDGLLALRDHDGATPENAALLAKVMVQLGDGYSAERYLRELEAKQGETPEWMTLRARSLILQGHAWKARDVIEQWPGYPTLAQERDLLLVWAAMEEGENDQAIALIDEALRRHPQSADLHAKAARLAAWEGNWEAADLHIADALAADPDHYEAQLVQGESLIAGGDLEGALATYQRVVETHPDFAIPRANVVGLRLDLMQLPEAEAALNEALARYPEFPQLRFALARLSAIKGDWTKSREILQSLPSEWKREFPASTLLEAETEAALGNHAIARTLYEQLAQDPRFADAANELMGQLPDA